MKTILLTLAAGFSMLAQTPAVKKPASATSTTKSTTAKTTTTRSAPAKSTTPPAPQARNLMNPAALKAKAPDLYKVKVVTTKGDIVIEVHRDWAPNGADRFYNLVNAGYFDNASFFRVLPGFMAQFGINANPAVNKVWMNANIKDDPVKESNKRGYVTFAAASSPNSRSTQVFINYADKNVFLDPSGFAPFGIVLEGMEVADKFYSGYGEGAPSGSGPDQGRAQAEAKPYLDKNFPLLDSIKYARVVVPPRPAPAAKPSPTGVKKTLPVKPATK